MSLHALFVLLISSGFLGGGLSPVLSVVNANVKSTRAKTLIVFVGAVAAAAATTYGQVSPIAANRATLLAFGTSLSAYVVGTFGSYHALWNKLGVSGFIERISTIERDIRTWYEKLPASKRTQIDNYVESRAQQLAAALRVPDPASVPAAPDAAPAPATPAPAAT